jgi:serine/threonine protein kinase
VDYQYDATADELGRGGMAVVYHASRPSATDSVALKRPLPWPQAAERMRREIEALTAVNHPHVMPVIEHGVDEAGEPWYAMPLAAGSLKKLWEGGQLGSDPERVCLEVLEDICSGLGAMHAAGYVHRDVTPTNVLAFRDPARPDGMRWVIADCGLARRPLGATTDPLTGNVSRLGTDGYMAPESFGAPHSVSESADVYSLGRIFAGILTGERPSLIVPLLPAAGPWRAVVREFTRSEPADRPQTMAAAFDRAQGLLSSLPTSAKVDFRTLAKAMNGRVPPADPMWVIVEDNADDRNFMVDDLVLINSAAASELAKARPDFAAAIAEHLALHMTSTEWAGRSFDFANVHLGWIKAVLVGLLAVGREDLFGDIAPTYCEAVRNWDRYSHNDALVRWLVDLRGPAANSMARAIRDSGTVDYFTRIVDGRRVGDPVLAALLEP